MRLDQLISGLGITCATAGIDPATVRVCDLTEDSRTAVPGSLFIARAGTRDDGTRYIQPAIDCGCVAVLTDHDHAGRIEMAPRARARVAVLVCDDVPITTALLAERFYGEPAGKLVCAGITGTNGKTTIAHLADQLIEGAGIGCGLIGTVEIDDGRQRARASMTTPPAVEMSRTLATMVEHGCRAVVMEVSSHALDQVRVGAIAFDAAVFTNLTGDHLDYHKTIEHYTQSKAKLFTQLKPGAIAAINTDDPASKRMIDACAKDAQVIRCGTSGNAHAEVTDESIKGMALTLTTPGGQISARVPIFGRYNAMNILQAVLVAQKVMTDLKVPVDEQRRVLIETLPTLTLPPGRLEQAHEEGDGLTVLVDFAHSDDALASALRAVRSVLPEGASLWCVFGCGGDRDTTKRPRMGKVVAEHADHIVITSDNPRTEVPGRIIEQILTGIDPAQRARALAQPDRASAIAHAIKHASPGDVIVIAGKGHETEQISSDGMGGTRTIHFDDREHARIALRERRFRLKTPPPQRPGHQQGAATP